MKPLPSILAFHSLFPLATLFCGLLLLPSCGGGGGGSGAPVSAAEVTVTFPAGSAVTDAATMTIRGRSHGPVAVASLLVNGVPARSSDAFMTFEAEVPLAIGANELTLVLSDVNGQSKTVKEPSRVIRQGYMVQSLTHVVAETGRNRFLGLDPGGRAIVRFDPATQQFSEVSGPNRGNGHSLGAPEAMTFDLGPDKIYVGPASQNSIVEVDPHTGDRRVLTSDTIAGQNGLLGIVRRPLGMVVDAQAGRLYVADAGSDAVYAVALTTGQVTLISGGNNASRVQFRRGSGPSMFNAEALVHDTAGGRLILVDSQSDQVIAIDPVTGNRQTLSSNSMPVQTAGPIYSEPKSLALTPSGQIAYVADLGSTTVPMAPARLLQVDLATGMRSVISEDGVGDGPGLRGLASAILDSAGERLVVSDQHRAAILAVDLRAATQGHRSVLGAAGIGAGANLSRPLGLALDPARRRILTADADVPGLVAVDRVSGDRWSFPTLDSSQVIEDVVMDPTRDRILVLGTNGSATSTGEIIALDPVSGARSVVPILGTFLGPSGPSVLLHDTNTLVMARAQNASSGPRIFLLAVDLSITAPSTSNPNVRMLSRSSNPVTGTGPALVNVRAIAADQTRNQVYVANLVGASNVEILSVDGTTGNRSLLSGRNRGSGPALEHAHGLTFHPGTNTLFVHQGALGITGVDLITGDRRMVSSSTMGEGPAYGAGGSLQMDGDRLLAIDPSQQSVLAVDPRTGDRLLLSR